ncbi:MAG TPA: hypothetical protein VIH21_03805, partial [Dehalococcoidia bacterium]
MCDVAGEPADSFDALNLQQVMLALAELALRTSALELGGDTACEQMKQGSRGHFVVQGMARDRHDGPDNIVPRSDERHGDVAIRVERRQRRVIGEMHADAGVERADRTIGRVFERCAD